MDPKFRLILSVHKMGSTLSQISFIYTICLFILFTIRFFVFDCNSEFSIYRFILFLTKRVSMEFDTYCFKFLFKFSYSRFIIKIVSREITTLLLLLEKKNTSPSFLQVTTSLLLFIFSCVSIQVKVL